MPEGSEGHEARQEALMPEPEYIEEPKALVVHRPAILSPVMDLAVAKKRLVEFQAFVREYLVEGEDFGKIPGISKPSLFKPGADKLCELYGLSDEFEIVDKVEDYTRNLFDYTIRCTLRRNGSLVATGLGSCNSYEGKYRWRDENRKCPVCSKEAIIKGKDEYGGGWVCFKKKGGCGAKWKDGDKAIEGQVTGKVENEDLPTQKNTILKMAKKRAKVDATLSATRSAGIFTQDVEDMKNRPQEAPEQEDGDHRRSDASVKKAGESGAWRSQEPGMEPLGPTAAPSVSHPPPEEHDNEISCTVYLVREQKTLPKKTASGASTGGGVPYLEVNYYDGGTKTMLCFDKQIFGQFTLGNQDRRYIFKFTEPKKNGMKRFITQVLSNGTEPKGLPLDNEDIPF